MQRPESFVQHHDDYSQNHIGWNQRKQDKAGKDLSVKGSLLSGHSVDEQSVTVV